MKWDNIVIEVAGKRIEVKSLSSESDLPVAPTLMGRILVDANRQAAELNALMPPAHQVILTHVLFSPSGLSYPRAWLLRWARKNGLQLVYDNAFVNDGRWIVGFAGMFPERYPKRLVRVSLTL